MTALALSAFAIAVAVLAFSIVTKVTDWSTTVTTWPVTGPARRLAGPTQVTALEAAAIALAIAPLLVAVRFIVVGALYAAYAAAAVALRGRRCACFGAAVQTTFSGRHAGLCALLAVLVFAGSAADDSGTGSLSGLAGAASVVGAGAALVVGNRRSAQRTHGTLPGEPERATRIVVLGDADCPICTALWQQRIELSALAACDVELRYPTSDTERDLAEGRFPAAVGYDSSGVPVAGPVWGPVDIRRLLRATNPSDMADATRTQPTG